MERDSLLRNEEATAATVSQDKINVHANNSKINDGDNHNQINESEEEDSSQFGIMRRHVSLPCPSVENDSNINNRDTIASTSYGSTDDRKPKFLLTPPEDTYQIDDRILDEDELNTTRPSSSFQLDLLTTLQACVFIEDAISYRSIYHKMDEKSLKLYRLYYSLPIRFVLYATQFILHILAFIETPSSLSYTSDILKNPQRIELPCGVTQCLELLCLVILIVDVIVKCQLIGRQQTLHSRWLLLYIILLFISLVDWLVSVSLICQETVRIRRYFRPIFLFQHSSLMKKMVRCLMKSFPQILSVLVLLFIHLYFFTLFGMLLFTVDLPKDINFNNITTQSPLDDEQQIVISPSESKEYFSSLYDSIMSLVVLLTTANNPDLMVPAYIKNRFYSIYFIVFIVIGVYCFMNMLTAVVYNQFRGYFMDSMQSSLFRRRLGIRAAFEVLRNKHKSDEQHIVNSSDHVEIAHLEQVMFQINMDIIYKSKVLKQLKDSQGTPLSLAQFEGIFAILEISIGKGPRPPKREVSGPVLQKLQNCISHIIFTRIGCAIALVNIILISVELATEYEKVMSSSSTALAIMNMIFVFYYLLEQCAKIWALGWNRYLWDRTNVFDGSITLILVILEGIYLSFYGLPFNTRSQDSAHFFTLWDLVRLVNILIMTRLLRIIVEFKAMFVVFSTLVDLLNNLKSFLGIMVTIFYIYALLGMQLFRGVIKAPAGAPNITFQCGSYEELNFWSMNFDDFGATLVLLWDVMVVNNWQVFLHAFEKYVSRWAVLYFIFWWLLATIICLNLFTALILENFIMRWDRIQRSFNERDRTASFTTSTYLKSEYMTVHDMFRNDLQEPTEEALLTELDNHPHMIWLRV